MAAGSPGTASRCTCILAPRRAAQADFNRDTSPAQGCGHRPPRPPRPALRRYATHGGAAFMPGSPFRSGRRPDAARISRPHSPPEGNLHLPKCRSFAHTPASQPASGAATAFVPSAGGLCPAGRLPAAHPSASWTASVGCRADSRKSCLPRRWPALPFTTRRSLLHLHHPPNNSVSGGA